MLQFQKQIEETLLRDDAADISEQMLLYWLIRAGKHKNIVEIGTHKGMSTLYMAHALYDEGIDGKVITMDPIEWDQRKTFRSFPELQPFIDFRMIKGEDLVVDDKVDFLFVDGYHEAEWVTREFTHFEPYLSEKAVVVFHDAAGDNSGVGVNKAVLSLGIQNAWIPTPNCIRIYGHMVNPPEK